MNPRIGQMLTYFMGHNAEIWYWIINPILSYSCILFMFRLGTGKWPDFSYRSTSTFLFGFISFLGFATGITWYLDNMNWLYPCTLTLGLFCLIEHFFKGDFRLSWSRTMAAIPLCIITGMSNNNTPIVTWALISGCGIYWCIIKKQSKISSGYLAILTTLTISCLIFYLAPGTYERAQVANWELSLSNIIQNSLLVPQNWLLILILFWRFITSAILLLAAKYFYPYNITWPRISILCVTFLCLWGVLLTAPCWGAPRAYCPMELVVACILIHLYHKLSKQISAGKSILFLAIYTCIMATHFVPMLGGISAANREWNRIEQMAQTAKMNGRDILIIKKSELDFTPAFPRLWKLPASFFNYKIKPRIPFIGTHERNTTHANHIHKWVDSTWDCDSGDQIMNPLAARKLGMKAVYYLPDK